MSFLVSTLVGYTGIIGSFWVFFLKERCLPQQILAGGFCVFLVENLLITILWGKWCQPPVVMKLIGTQSPLGSCIPYNVPWKPWKMRVKYAGAVSRGYVRCSMNKGRSVYTYIEIYVYIYICWSKIYRHLNYPHIKSFLFAFQNGRLAIFVVFCPILDVTKYVTRCQTCRFQILEDASCLELKVLKHRFGGWRG